MTHVWSPRFQMSMPIAVLDAGRCAMISWRGGCHITVEATPRDSAVLTPGKLENDLR